MRCSSSARLLNSKWARKKGTTDNFSLEITFLISFYVFFFFYSSISIHFRSRHRPESYKYKKVDFDLCFALINHNSYSVFVLTHDAINNGGAFCCFLSEGDAKSDFNWFASVFYFIILVIYRIIFDREDMKVDCMKVNDQKEKLRINRIRTLCLCFWPPEEFSHSNHLKTSSLVIQISSRMDYLTFIRSEGVFHFIWGMEFSAVPKNKDRKNV